MAAVEIPTMKSLKSGSEAAEEKKEEEAAAAPAEPIEAEDTQKAASGADA